RHTSPACPASRGYLGSGTCVFTLNGLDPAPPPEPGFFCPFGAAPPAQTIAPPPTKVQAARYQLTARSADITALTTVSENATPSLGILASAKQSTAQRFAFPKHLPAVGQSVRSGLSQ